MKESRYTFPVVFDREALTSGLALSRLASWNQTFADWDSFWRLGKLRAVRVDGGGIVGTIGVLPLGERISWISLVLVNPEHRGRGLARRMMEWALSRAREEGWTAMLDATEAGARVYRKLGFEETGKLSRCVIQANEIMKEVSASEPMTSLGMRDLIELRSWDFARSGLDRGELLIHWVSEHRAMGWISRNKAGEIVGYSLSRPGYKYPQVGPVFAERREVAWKHLDGHLRFWRTPVLMDLTESGLKEMSKVCACSVEVKREFLRMGLDGKGPGITEAQYAVGGPEFG